MRYLAAAVGFLALIGCDDAVEPRGLGPYEVTTLRTLPEGAEASFVDLNENGQALWHEGEQAILWDQGAILQVPVGRFLGSSGEVLGESSLWLDGELTELPGTTRGILDDGTIYLSRNDTMFTWRDGVVQATDGPVGLVGPEGRIWYVQGSGSGAQYIETCMHYFNGQYTSVIRGWTCRVVMAEENGWAIVSGEALLEVEGGGLDNIAVVPAMYQILDSDGNALLLGHVNSEGHAVAVVGILGKPDDTRMDLNEHFEGTVRLGGINDDGEILAQLDDRVVLLSPR